MILAGGLGTRLKSEVADVQKTMADVGGRPFMDIILEHIVSQGFRRVIICTGHNAESVQRYYESKDFGIDIVFSHEQEKLGTGGAIKNAASLVQSDVFFVMNGDSFCPVKFSDFLTFHQTQAAAVSIAVSEVKDIKDYGSIMLDDSHQIVFFGEKLSADDTHLQNQQVFVNNGIYCFQKEVFGMMPESNKFSLEKDFFPHIIGKSFYGFAVEAKFLDIGVPERYREAREKFK